MTWPRYPEYRNTSLPWLGQIPEHWDVRKLKFIASVTLSNVDKKTDENEEPVRLCNYIDVYYNDFITSELELMHGSATRTEIEKFTLKRGDVIVTKDSESWDDIAVPAYVPADLDGVLCGYHLAIIRADKRISDGGYLFRAFAARGVNDQFRVAATGITRYGLGKYWLDNSLFPVPPIDEQLAIVRFLDRKMARIDQLLVKVERLAGKLGNTATSLLAEYRTALITAAITGKIDVRKEVS
jgi:type I restriction enzyme S subunit